MTPIPSLSTESLAKLAQVHLDLRTLVLEVVKTWPCIVLEGYRDEQSQNEAFDAGRSKLRYPLSKHNQIPAAAVDLSPYPYEPQNVQRAYYFACYVMATAANLGLKIRFGGDWEQTLDPEKNKFDDLFHFELIN